MQYRAGLPARRPRFDCRISARAATRSRARTLRRRTYAYLRRNCHAKPIGWLANGFGSSSSICPARQSRPTGQLRPLWPAIQHAQNRAVPRGFVDVSRSPCAGTCARATCWRVDSAARARSQMQNRLRYVRFIRPLPQNQRLVAGARGVIYFTDKPAPPRARWPTNFAG